MFEVEVQHEFCAAHALTIAGVKEPIHGHNWRVRAVVAGKGLDRDGLLCDFHAVHEVLASITDRFANNNLNDIGPFNTIQPSAENVAKVIAEEMSSRLAVGLGSAAWVESVSVTEAPGCRATFRFDRESAR